MEDESLGEDRLAYIGLGSNLGDPLENLRRAVSRLESSDSIRSITCSSVYRSRPVGYLDQPDFLNAVVRVLTDLDPIDLLLLCRSIESALGRKRKERWGPRTMDLDILLFEGEEVLTEELTIPHPRMAERGFVLLPLLEVEPDARFPDGSLIRESLEGLPREDLPTRTEFSLRG